MRLDNFYIAVLIIGTFLLAILNHHIRRHGEINPDLYISEVVKVVEMPLRKVVRVTISAVKSVTRWLIGLSEDDQTAHLNHISRARGPKGRGLSRERSLNSRKTPYRDLNPILAMSKF